MSCRHHLLASFSAVVFTVALSSGCSEDENPTPRVTFDSSIAPGTHKQAECPKTGLWFTIGSFGTPAAGRVDPNDPESPLKDPVRPVENGGADQQGSVSLSCSIVESGPGFDVRASAQLTGATGGAFTLIGNFTKTGDQGNLTLSMTKKGETFSQTGCTAKYDPQVGQGVAAGRVWASIVCPNAEAPSIQQVCETKAEIRLENCSQ
jgi:hypothetical protein